MIKSRRLAGWATLALITGGMIMATSLDAQNLEQLQRAVAPVMKLSDEQMLELIPDRAGLLFVGCPNCTGGTQENQLWWTIERPHEVYCRYCDMRYPNDTYPDDQVLRVTNDRGQKHAYPYWDDADGYHHFFQAKGWYVSRLYFEDSALRLAQLYGMTGDDDYARRAALILRRFAEVYPGYLVHYDYPFRQKVFWSGEEGFPYPVPDSEQSAAGAGDAAVSEWARRRLSRYVGPRSDRTDAADRIDAAPGVGSCPARAR